MKELGKVLLFEGDAGKLRLVELPKPAIAETEVLVRIEAASICGSDLHSIHGKRKVPIPTILGHEIVGVVEAIGNKVNPEDILGRKIIPGDRITWSVVANCGSCQLCQKDIPQKCLHSVKYGHEALKEGSQWNGGFAQWCVLVAGTKIVKLPQSIPLEVACSTSCALSRSRRVPRRNANCSRIARSEDAANCTASSRALSNRPEALTSARVCAAKRSKAITADW